MTWALAKLWTAPLSGAPHLQAALALQDYAARRRARDRPHADRRPARETLDRHVDPAGRGT